MIRQEPLMNTAKSIDPPRRLESDPNLDRATINVPQALASIAQNSHGIQPSTSINSSKSTCTSTPTLKRKRASRAGLGRESSNSESQNSQQIMKTSTPVSSKQAPGASASLQPKATESKHAHSTMKTINESALTSKSDTTQSAITPNRSSNPTMHAIISSKLLADAYNQLPGILTHSHADSTASALGTQRTSTVNYPGSSSLAINPIQVHAPSVPVNFSNSYVPRSCQSLTQQIQTLLPSDLSILNSPHLDQEIERLLKSADFAVFVDMIQIKLEKLV